MSIRKNMAVMGVLLPVAVLASAPAQAVPRTDLAPHKALYDIKMIAKSSTSQVLNISGKMYFEMKAGCEAWTTDHRFQLNYEYTDSAPVSITSDFTTYEPYNGETLDFNSQRKRGGEVFDELRGQAVIEGDGPGLATYTVPEGMKYRLPPLTMFPMGHTAALAREARDGRKFFSATVFDGSDEDGPVEISAFIGEEVESPALARENDNIDKSLLRPAAHKLRMAFFPLSTAEASADYEMSAVFHNNGIISDMIVEYQDFTVSQSLQALEAMPPAECDPPEGKAGAKGD